MKPQKNSSLKFRIRYLHLIFEIFSIILAPKFGSLTTQHGSRRQIVCGLPVITQFIKTDTPLKIGFGKFDFIINGLI
jgi:hypothetical protein